MTSEKSKTMEEIEDEEVAKGFAEEARDHEELKDETAAAIFEAALYVSGGRRPADRGRYATQLIRLALDKTLTLIRTEVQR